jgi:hypothetical protein
MSGSGVYLDHLDSKLIAGLHDRAFFLSSFPLEFCLGIGIGGCILFC